MPVAQSNCGVVVPPPLRVPQRVPGLVDLAHSAISQSAFALRGLVVAVRVEHTDQTSVGLADLVRISIGLQTQHLIVITGVGHTRIVGRVLGHCSAVGQCCGLAFRRTSLANGSTVVQHVRTQLGHRHGPMSAFSSERPENRIELDPVFPVL
jgi:hypothetical protein